MLEFCWIYVEFAHSWKSAPIFNFFKRPVRFLGRIRYMAFYNLINFTNNNGSVDLVKVLISYVSV